MIYPTHTTSVSRYSKALFFTVLAALLFAGCAVVGGIFKAGMVVAIVGVVIVIALIIGIASMFRKR